MHLDREEKNYLDRINHAVLYKLHIVLPTIYISYISIAGHSTYVVVVAVWAKNHGKTLYALERPLVVPLINCTKLTALCSDSLKWMHFALHSHLFFWEREREQANKLRLPASQPAYSYIQFFLQRSSDHLDGSNDQTR